MCACAEASGRVSVVACVRACVRACSCPCKFACACAPGGTQPSQRPFALTVAGRTGFRRLRRFGPPPHPYQFRKQTRIYRRSLAGLVPPPFFTAARARVGARRRQTCQAESDLPGLSVPTRRLSGCLGVSNFACGQSQIHNDLEALESDHDPRAGSNFGQCLEA